MSRPPRTLRSDLAKYREELAFIGGLAALALTSGGIVAFFTALSWIN